MSKKMPICLADDLTNEASVEALFVLPLLLDVLGYKTNDVLFKTAIQELSVNEGRRKVPYRPDYIIKANGLPAIVVDAKHPHEQLEKWRGQCSSYCLELNKMYAPGYNPVRYYILTNGLSSELYAWDSEHPILMVSLDDFGCDSDVAQEFIASVNCEAIISLSREQLIVAEEAPFEFHTVEVAELEKVFLSLHKKIRDRESMNASNAFNELIKLIFVKMQEDKKIHERYGNAKGVKRRQVVFSTFWIDRQTESDDPVNKILLDNLLRQLECEIRDKNKKRFFDQNEKIALSPETIRLVVEAIEHIDFFAMDEDVAGRIFETFLDAAARGKELGQFFTPREIVKLAVDLADPEVTLEYVPHCLDACCGSGGFLIGLMNKMVDKASKLSGMSSRELDALVETICEHRIFGIDSGTQPAMYRIARMNMYIHGDGGSNIYCADSLYKGFRQVGPRGYEADQQFDELCGLIAEDGRKFDLIVSNPPFSVKYSWNDVEQRRTLEQYEIAKEGRLNGNQTSGILSSVLFLERYADMVSDDGKIFAIIDDSILSSRNYAFARDYLRKHFIIRAIISLPGDAFSRSEARVKTSLICLTKKKEGERQGSVFMGVCRYVGLEEKVAKRIGVDPESLPALKAAEHKRLVESFMAHSRGLSGDYSIPSKSISDRMDVKYCIGDRGRKKDLWQERGYAVSQLGQVLETPDGRQISVAKGEEYQLLKVSYSGGISRGDVLIGGQTQYKKLYVVRTWDILISGMGFGRGALGIVPPHLDGFYVSGEYLVLSASSNRAAVFYSRFLRSKEFLGDVFSVSTGMNRGRVPWDMILKLEVPECPDDERLDDLVAAYEKAWGTQASLSAKLDSYSQKLSDVLMIDEDDSFERWLGYKPPE